MMENLVWILGAVAYACAGVAYFKWKLNEIEKTSNIKPQKQAKHDTPCYDCL